MYYYIKKSIIFAKISDCEFAQFATRVRPLESSIILGNLRGNCRSASASRLLPSNFSATDPARISPFGDEVAPFSAARQSAYLGTNAFTSPGSFGCGCAALSEWRGQARCFQRAASARPFSTTRFSALHFSAFDFFVSFSFFRLSPKNHTSVFSVSRKEEKKTKKHERMRRPCSYFLRLRS